MNKIFAFITLLSLSNLSFSDDEFLYFIAGNHASTETLLQSIESFDSEWAKQIGAYISTINLDIKYQKLSEDYKKCVYLSVNNHDSKKLDIAAFFSNTQKECDPYILKLREHIKTLIKK
jgi:hypothetical protein